MKLGNRLLFISFLLRVFTILSFLCIKGRYETGRIVIDIIGTKIELSSDSLFQEKIFPKILVVVEDTGECTTCTMQVYDWYLYKLDLDEHNLSCDIIYILNDSVSLSSEIKSLLGYYHLNYIKDTNTFLNQNEWIRKNSIRTFLIDKEGHIQLVGSPIGNMKLWTLYKNKIEKLIG